MAEKKLVEGLKWVKGEIAATLRPVHDLVEAAGLPISPLDPTAATQSLDQVQGVLLALQLYTPARLAQEMSLLTECISADGAGPGVPARVMGQALTQLNHHLDRLDAGFDEQPLSLWPIINEVRAARGDQPLTHAELLTFAAVNAEGDARWTPESLALLAEAVRQVRPQYHRYLVEWYRGDRDSQSLAHLEGVFHHLRDVFKEGVLADLFRLAGLFTAALRNGGLTTDPHRRSLMGHLDWVLKPLAHKPPQWPEVDALALIEHLLNALPESSASSPVVAQLRSWYGPQQAGISPPFADPADLGGDEALAGLAATLLGEFSQLKEQFDVLARGEQTDRATLDAFSAHLRRLAQTLDVADVGDLPARLRALADDFSALELDEIGKDQARLESQAMELLGIEAILLAHTDHRSTRAQQIIAPDMDLSDLTVATLREAGYELVRVKDAIANYHVERGAMDVLLPVWQHLLSISGALSILGEMPAAQLAKSIGDLVQQRYVKARRSPTDIEFEHLADAVAALELYIGHLQEAVPFGGNLIARGDQSVAALLSELGETPELPTAAAMGEAPAPLDLEPPRAVEQPGNIQAIISNQSVSRNTPDLIESELADETEFLDIFMEEAREETASAQMQFARWESAPNDASALASLRRSFHTLKGSGRLVGALQVAEFAQAVEFLLNRLIEEQRPPSSEILGCVAEAVRLLPELVSAEADGRQFDVNPLITRANQLREAASLPPDTEPTDALSLVQLPDDLALVDLAAQMTDHDSLFAADEELLRIFQAETHEHLTELRAFLLRAEAGDAKADEATQRALHTLTGSARMAGIDSIAIVTRGLEQCIKPTLAQGRALDDGLLALIRRAVDGIGARVDELPAFGTGAAALVGLAADIEQLGQPGLELDIPAANEPLQPSEPLFSCVAITQTEAVPDDALEFSPAQSEPAISDWESLAETAETIDNSVEFSLDALEMSTDEQIDAGTDAQITGAFAISDRESLAEMVETAETADESVEFALDTLEMSAEALIDADADAQIAEALAETAETIDNSVEFALDALELSTEALIDASADEVAGHEALAVAATSEFIDLPEDTDQPPLPVTDVMTDSGQPATLPEPAEPAASTDAPDPEMAAIFLEDARDLLDNLDAQFRDWRAAPQDISALDGINRLLHTLKGSARLTGLAVIGDLSHALETRLKALSEDPGAINDQMLELAQRALDRLSVQVDALEQGMPIPRMTSLIALLDQASLEVSDAPEVTSEVTRMPPVTPVVEALTADESTESLQAGAEGPAAVPGSPQIRVRSDLLNRLVNHAGEISIYRGRLTQRNGLLGFGLGELDQTVVRLREQLRLLEIETQAQIMHRFERDRDVSDYDGEFDPLELDRFSRLQQLSGSLAETVNDLVSVKDMLGGYQREFTDLLNQQARLADDLQDGLLRTRLVPFVQVVPRLHRLVRQTADSLDKSARLEVIGPEVELDRTILDRLVAPLEHLLRNAVDHGLEDPEARRANGKPATGKVTLALHREGNDAVISLRDDGKGMNLDAIRRQAIARGLLAPRAILPDEALLQFILEPGFTTSDKITQISGRGVGLDVVASEIKAANGSIALESVTGQGARFTIRLPLTLAIIEAFLVSVGDSIYAVPHSTVEAVARIGRDDLLAIYRGESNDFTLRDHSYKVVYLGGVLDSSQEPELGERRWLPLLLIRFGEQRVALHVDSLLESQRILVKPLGPQLAGVRWLSGGTILPDGRVALILDALALLRSGAVQSYRPVTAVADTSRAPICVMVVDDSITVRRVTSRLLRRQNMEVLTAKDGVEALTLLDERMPDLLLLDIEMPRMDGYELTRHIRRSEGLRDLPIIMITSRTGAKHRDYAMQLGVDRYLGKPYQESELLNEINSLLTERSEQSRAQVS
jgi:chemosensory pili system protein ChpA (sensor histidine kinase/response regulator)